MDFFYIYYVEIRQMKVKATCILAAFQSKTITSYFHHIIVTLLLHYVWLLATLVLEDFHINEEQIPETSGIKVEEKYGIANRGKSYP